MFIADDGRTRSADFPRKVITGRFRVICGKNFALGCPVAGFYERPLWRSPWKSETPDLRFPRTFVNEKHRRGLPVPTVRTSCNKKPAENVNQG